MRLPSHQRTHVSRRIALRLGLAAAVAALIVVPAGAAGTRTASDVFASKGSGRQIFAGGGGAAYGKLSSGASLIVTDYSPKHDLKVEAPVPPIVNADGSRTYVPAGGTQSTAYLISGSVYRVVITGQATLNASGIFGRLQVRGAGAKNTLSVNGRKVRWNGPAIKISDPPKALRAVYRLAVDGTPPPVAAPVLPPATPVTTVTTTPSSG
jgi:hypothetical protein